MTWASLFVRLSSFVVVLPLVLSRFAPAEVAVWMLFSSILTLTLLLDLGLAPTFSRLFSYALGGVGIEHMAAMRREASNGDQLLPARDPAPTVSRVFAALRWIYPRLATGSVALLSVGGTVMLREPISHCPDAASMWLAWAAVLIGAYAGIVGNAFSVVLQGMNEVALQKRLDMALGIAQTLSCFAVLLFGGGILALVIAYQGWTIIGGQANRILVGRCFSYLSTVRPLRDRAVLTVLWPSAWRSGVGVLMSHGLIQASGLVYSQLVSARELASYLLAVRVITLVSQVSQAPFYSKLPELARLHALGDSGKCLVVARRGMKLAQAVLSLGVVAVALCSDRLLDLIGSKIPFVPPSLWALIAVAFFVERFGAMHLQLYSVTNHITWHIANGVTGTLMIAISVALYPSLGIVALPAAMLIAYSIFYAPYASRASSRAFGFSLWTFESRASIPAFVCMAGALSAITLLSKLTV